MILKILHEFRYSRLGPNRTDDSAHIIMERYDAVICKSVLSAESVTVNPRTLELLVGLIYSYCKKQTCITTLIPQQGIAVWQVPRPLSLFAGRGQVRETMSEHAGPLAALQYFSSKRKPRCDGKILPWPWLQDLEERQQNVVQ